MNCLLTLTNVSDINDAVFTLVYILGGLVAYHLFDNKPFVLVTNPVLTSISQNLTFISHFGPEFVLSLRKKKAQLSN
jgi:hypothetical protein